jgi:2'-5' RNA ligase
VSDHAFLAIDLTTDERHALSAALTGASPGKRLPGKHTLAENWHITTRFLGECSVQHAERIMHQLSETMGVEEGRVWCEGLGAFPKPSKASVVYVGIDDPDGVLERLAAASDDAAESAGFEPEGRPYVPHLTLARVRPPVDVGHVLESWDDFRVPIGVRGVTLFRTRRSRAGNRYDPIDTVAL